MRIGTVARMRHCSYRSSYCGQHREALLSVSQTVISDRSARRREFALTASLPCERALFFFAKDPKASADAGVRISMTEDENGYDIALRLEPVPKVGGRSLVHSEA